MIKLNAQQWELVKWLGDCLKEDWEAQDAIPEFPGEWFPRKTLQAKCDELGLDIRITTAIFGDAGLIEWHHFRAEPECYPTNRVITYLHQRDLDQPNAKPEESNLEDGPLQPKSFAWKGQEYQGMKPTACRLVHYLWKLPARRDEFDNLAEPVWDDREVQVGKTTLSSATREANRFFKLHDLPFRATISGRFVSLIDWDWAPDNAPPIKSKIP